ncbi:ATP-binding cassette domain-containing protein [Sulfolobus acidocaldarius]|uniref:ABC transporter, ATPase component n=4 Tax=Sulfolobus acidocaldarius TaxID=2285 RepID=Q4J7C7_SULAC|nr:ABC transporter ATP-binding protein [Sulfolobus acidocaldarius]AAY81299.1 ABC transporter, ATPase component [Sulfolobus acidocaldarius DSM 639]AGE71937.1 ABC transporter, ATPase component [Sulfolobus acidocaldarius N8]AGE74209.1 ABC transporter, ATPase component [Sulfolobus acidocaldarius Ron12/I]ALU29898.1 ABC transporter ATP-binding protein [Sulfolobus acidocaldarius]ALU32639.1 ABC transporter ATP-binding protein [Sulfolobus acidocaldarius]
MILVSNGLTKVLGKRKALDNVSFKAEGKNIVVLGHNGSGKTTLLNIISGLLRPNSGNLTINGIEPYRHKGSVLKLLSFSFEKPRFELNMKVRDYYSFLKEFEDSDCMEFFWEQLDMKSLANSHINDLSSGQTQLINMSQAICRKTEIKVLDEPFAHLDPMKVGLLGEYLLKRGFEFVITTHVADEADWLADYLVILRDGKLVWSGSYEEIKDSNIYEVFVRYNMTDLGLEVLSKVQSVMVVKSTEEQLSRMLKEGKILGFKSIGVRRYYK